MTHRLVFVRSIIVYAVPPVCTAYWSVDDWMRVSRRVTEPLIIDALGLTWIATGERNARGNLLYQVRT